MATAAHSYTSTHFALELDGQVGFLEAASGGEASGDVIEETVGPDLVVRKHIAGVSYSDIAIECGVGGTKGLYTWITDMLGRKATRKSGAVLALDYDYTARRRLAFSNGLLTEVAFPAVDAASKDAARISVKLTPEFTQLSSATGTKLSGSVGKGTQKQWRRSNFRLTIDGLDCTRVSRIESLLVRQPVVQGLVGQARDYMAEPSALDIDDLIVTLPEAHAQDWYAWHHDFVIQGNSSPLSEKTGKLQFLAPNMKDVLFELSFKGLGIHTLAPEAAQQQETAHGISRVRASMYCEEITFASPQQVWSETAAAPAQSANGSAPTSSGGEPATPAPPSRVDAVVPLAQSSPESLLPARVGASRIRPI